MRSATTTHMPDRRSTAFVLLLMVALLASWTAAAPAWAQEQPADEPAAEDSDDGDDGDDEDPDPDRPRIQVEAEPACEPEPGFHYEITFPAPLLLIHAEWRETVDGQINVIGASSGFVPSGEGEFELRGLVLSPAAGPQPTPWVSVTVDCPDDVPPPDDDPNPDIVPGTPNFTG